MSLPTFEGKLKFWQICQLWFLHHMVLIHILPAGCRLLVSLCLLAQAEERCFGWFTSYIQLPSLGKPPRIAVKRLSALTFVPNLKKNKTKAKQIEVGNVIQFWSKVFIFFQPVNFK